MPVILPNATTSTIVLLETVGQSASLRYASKSDLARALDQMGASEGLKSASASGDRAALKLELGFADNLVPQVNQNPGQGMWDPDAEA